MQNVVEYLDKSKFILSQVDLQEEFEIFFYIIVTYTVD